MIPLGRIIADPDQPRTHFDEEKLQQLAESLKDQGQIVPITVRIDRTYHGDDGKRYIVETGERRWRAAQLANLESLKCVIEKKSLSPEEKLIRQYVENEVRDNLNPIDKAKTYQSVLDSGKTVRDAAKMLHTSPATISRTVKLLTLSEDEQRMIATGEIPPTLAYEIASIPDEAERKKRIESSQNGESKKPQSGSTKPGSKTLKATKAKRKKIGKFSGELHGPKNATNAEYIDFLENWAAALRNDGRSRKAA